MALEDGEVANLGKTASVGVHQGSVNDQELEAALGLANAGANNALKSKVQFRFEAMKLPNLDTGSKSDCFLVLYTADGNVK